MYEFYKTASLSDIQIVDQEDRVVEGFLGDDNVDFAGHYIERAPYMDAIRDWLKWGNIRDSHDKPVGIVLNAQEKSWNHIKVKIVDDNVWNLVKGGVYKGFSIGARVLGAEFVPLETVPMDKFAALPEMVMTALKQFGQILKINALQIVEVSVTDRPMNPGAVFTKSMSLYGLQLNDGDYKMNELNQETTTITDVVETPEVVEKEVTEDMFDAKAEIEALRQLVDEKYASLTTLVENQVATLNKTLGDLQAIAESFAKKDEEVKTKDVQSDTVVETVENAAKVEPAFDMDKFASMIAETVFAKVEAALPKTIERQNEVNTGEQEKVEKEAKVDIGSLPVNMQAKYLAAQIAKTLNGN